MKAFHPRILRLLVLQIFVAAAGWAGVVFDSERLEVKVGPEQEQVEVDFGFENRGPGEAKVVSVVSGCQCLLAEAPEEPVAAGGRGIIHGVFKVGAFNGTVEKQMMAKIEEGGVARDVVLTVAVVVPEVIRVEPGTLEWKVGGEAKEQAFVVNMVWNEPIHVLTVESSREEFDLRLETVEDGRVYKLFVKPKDLARPMLGLVQFMTDCRFEKFRKPMAFLSVREAP